MSSIHKSLKQREALKPLLLIYALEYGIRNCLKLQKGLELNGMYHALDYADGVSLLVANVPP
jgi:hypothetical protein